MNKILAGCFFLLLSTHIMAQFRGVVYGSNGEKSSTIYGAKAKLLHANKTAITGPDGNFEFILSKESNDTIVVWANGYYPDTIYVTPEDRFSFYKITLFSDVILPEVVVEYQKSSKGILKMRTLLVEEISSDELRKAACCNLSESFETNASVDVSFTDAVSGAKQIQMMGLNGVYTQLQMENIPYLRGLESAFGLNSLPGTWINSIQITKGTGPVVNGYESMAGLINLDIKKPHMMERFYVNGYGNSFGRAELNFHGSVDVSEKWSTALFVHGSNQAVKLDNNQDNFRDIPTGTFYAGLNRWHYQGERMEAQIGINVYQEDKLGGEMELDRSTGVQANSDFFGVRSYNEHVNVFAKTGFFFKNNPARSIGVLYNFKAHNTNGFYGLRSFGGEERRANVNLIYDDILGSTLHKTRLGLSGTVVDFNQQIFSESMMIRDDRLEIIPGAFAEYTYTGIRLVNVIGARMDYHNLFGPIFSPRIHSKFTLTEKLDLRFTAGRAWRVPNYQVDYRSLLATGRTWVAPNSVQPEISWNIGGSAVYSWKWWKREASLVMDYYHTTFENQLVVDRDLDPSLIVFNYTSAPSYSNSFQAEFSMQPWRGVEVRTAYKFLEARAEFGGVMQNKVMVPKHRGFANIAYQTRNKRWEFDATASVFGKSRLPVNILSNGELTTDNESEVFPLVSAQVTHVYKRFDFYLGGENLANYTMQAPIFDAENPFGTTFDATRVWAPIMGQMFYFGFRFTIERKTEFE